MTAENRLVPESPEQVALSTAETELLASLPEELQQEAQVVLEFEKAYQPEVMAGKFASLKNWQRVAWVRWTLTGLVLLVALSLAAPLWQKLFAPDHGVLTFFNSLRQSVSMMSEENLSPEKLRLREKPQTPYTQKERLLQDLDWAGLHELEPENPVWHQYLMMENDYGEALPADWRDSLAEIDPENSVLPMYAAMTEQVKEFGNWDDVYTRENDPETDEDIYTIHDEETFFAIRDQLLEALELPRFEIYAVSEQMLAASFPEGKTSLDHPSQAKLKVLYSLFSRAVYATTAQLQSARVLALEANRAAKAGEVEAFQRVLKVAYHWSEQLLGSEPDSLIEIIVSETVVAILAKEFAKSGETLGMKDEVAQMANFAQARQERRERLRNRKEIEFPREKMSAITVITVPVTNLIAEQRHSYDFLPGVREERAWGFSTGLFLSFLLLLILILPLHWVARAAHGSVRTQLSSRLLALASWQAWLLLVLLAWALPLGVLWGVRTWEASSNLEFSLIFGLGHGSDLGHPLVVMALSLVLVRIWARRLFPAAKEEGNRGWLRFDFCALLLFLLCFGLLQLLPLVYEMPDLKNHPFIEEWNLFLPTGVIGLFLLLVLAQTLVVLLIPALKRKKAPLWLMLSSHASVPILALWALSFVCLSHFQQQEAGYWAFEDETILSVKNQTITETEIARQGMREIRALWIEAGESD